MKATIRNALFYAACIAAAAQGASAAPQTTNSVASPKEGPSDSTTNTPTISLVKSSKQTDWPTAFNDGFFERVTIKVTDAFVGPQGQLQWIRDQGVGYRLSADYANAGKSILERSTLDAFRESVTHLQGIYESKTFVNDLFVGSIGRTAEESIKPGGITPIEAQKAYWEDMRSDGNLSYGFRPLDGSPYGYFGGRFGRSGNGPLGTFDIRGRYDPVLLKSITEAQFTLFMTQSSTITFGGSYYPTVSHGEEQGPNWSVIWMNSSDTNIHKPFEFASLSGSKENGLMLMLGAGASF
jgi:hypothetical protein